MLSKLVRRLPMMLSTRNTYSRSAANDLVKIHNFIGRLQTEYNLEKVDELRNILKINKNSIEGIFCKDSIPHADHIHRQDVNTLIKLIGNSNERLSTFLSRLVKPAKLLVDEHGRLSENIYRLGFGEVDDPKQAVRLLKQQSTSKLKGDVFYHPDTQDLYSGHIFGQIKTSDFKFCGLSCSLNKRWPNSTVLFEGTTADYSKLSVDEWKEIESKKKDFIVHYSNVFVLEKGSKIAEELWVDLDNADEGHVTITLSGNKLPATAPLFASEKIEVRQISELPFKKEDWLVISAIDKRLPALKWHGTSAEWNNVMDAFTEAAEEGREDEFARAAVVCALFAKEPTEPAEGRVYRELNRLNAMHDIIESYLESGFDFNYPVHHILEALHTLSSYIAKVPLVQHETAVRGAELELVAANGQCKVVGQDADTGLSLSVVKEAIQEAYYKTIDILCKDPIVPIALASDSLFVLYRADATLPGLDGLKVVCGDETLTLRTGVAVHSVDVLSTNKRDSIQTAIDGRSVHFSASALKELQLSKESMMGRSASADVCGCRVAGCGKLTLDKYRVGSDSEWVPLCSEHRSHIVAM